MVLALFSIAAKFMTRRRSGRAFVVALALSAFSSSMPSSATSSSLMLATAAGQGGAAGVVIEITAQIDAGQFAAAESRIAQALGGAGLAQNVRSDLEFQRERMRRIRLDFTLSDGYAAKLYDDQAGRCAVSGTEFHFESYPKALVR